MSAKIVPTDSQVRQLNLDRLTSIFKFPSEYFVKIFCSHDILLSNDESLWNTTYTITIGKSPREVSVPAKNKPGWFSKEFFKKVTRYTRVARINIHPYYSPERSVIRLSGNETENNLIHAKLDKVSRSWIFENGVTRDITLNINVFPESEKEYFDVE